MGREQAEKEALIGYLGKNVLMAGAGGLSSDQAIALGIIAGVTETLTEKISFDALFDAAKLGKDAFGYFLKNAVSEAGEEEISGSVNFIADILISKDKSEWQTSIDEYIARGNNKNKATALALADQAKAIGLDLHGGFLSGAAMSGTPIVATKAAGAFLSRGKYGENSRLTNADIPEYMQIGKRQHTRDEKARMVNAGKSPILSSEKDIRGFITDSITGKATGEVRAYGKVGKRLAKEVKLFDPDMDIYGNYLELTSDKLKHVYDRHKKAAQKGNTDLSERDFEKIADYIDSYDKVLSVEKHNGAKKIRIAQKINGYTVILSIVSKERQALHPINMIGISTESFEKKYGKIEKSVGSREETTAKAESPNLLNVVTHTDHTLSNNSIPETSEKSKRENFSNSGFTKNEYSGKISNKTIRALNAIGKKIGVNISIGAPTGTGQGAFNGYYENRRIVIAQDADDPLKVVLSHEVTHRLKETAPEAYAKFLEIAVNASEELSGKQKSEILEEYKAWYSDYTQTDFKYEDTLDEITADFAGRIVDDLSLFKKLVDTDRNVAQRFVDGIRDFISKVKTTFSKDKSKADTASMEKYGVKVS